MTSIKRAPRLGDEIRHATQQLGLGPGGERPAPTSRRRFLGIAGAAAGSLALLAACGPGASGQQRPEIAAKSAPVTTISAKALTGDALTSSPQPLVPSSPHPPVAPRRRPSVLLVTIDTLRADQLSSYGQPLVRTPTLDAFGAEGARFLWHTVHQPQTIPSHASILTGMYPTSDGVRIQLVDKLSATLDSAATAFARQGYTTAAAFSVPVFQNRNCHFQRGFDVYTDLTQGLVPGQPGEMLKSPAARTTDAAIAQLRAFGDQPFFFWLHYIDPHCPYVPPASFASRYDPNYNGTFNGGWSTVNAILAGKLHLQGPQLTHLKSLYQDEISYVDSEIGRLFTAMDQLGHRDNTAVAVTADHGESFAEHRDFFTGQGIYHPRSLYNTELHVPLLLRYPARIRPGTVVSAPTRAVDILPTLLELAEQPPLPQVQGKSLLPLLDGSGDDHPRISYAAMASGIFTSITTEGWKLIWNNASQQRHLFDLSADPGEMHDVQHANPDVADFLSSQLQSWMQAARIG